jgi:hypothetical protein
MSLEYNTDFGYGIRLVKRDAENGRPAGYIVEVHFYDKTVAVKYASQLIWDASQAATTRLEKI